MDDLQVEVCKIKQSPCLAVVEILGLVEVCQVFVVCKDLDGEGRSVEVVPSGLQGTDDGKELPVVDVVISFCWDKRLGEV